MEPYVQVTGTVVPLDRPNVDTDQIIPAVYLKRIERTGFGQFLFDAWRKLPDGSPNPDFVFNQPRYRDATVLVAGPNFGSGSSREHAPWALEDYGIRTIIAPSFADIFYNNCFKNGILPITLPRQDVEKLLNDAERGANATLTIDLKAQTIRGPDGGEISFDVEEFKKHCLLNGLDDIALTMENEAKIADFEKGHKTAQPWLAG